MAAPVPDEAFRALADSRRRQLLVALLEHNPQQEFSTVGDVESDGFYEEGERIDFQHTHLPLLEEHGYIEWDRDAGEITRGPDWDEIVPLLRALRRLDGLE